MERKRWYQLGLKVPKSKNSEGAKRIKKSKSDADNEVGNDNDNFHFLFFAFYFLFFILILPFFFFHNIDAMFCYTFSFNILQLFYLIFKS